MNAQDISSKYGFGIVVLRWAASVIDFVIFILITILTFWIADEKYYGFALNVLLLFLVVQYILLEGFLGYTIGKFVCRIKVVDINGKRPGFIKALIRTLLRLIDTNPILMGGLPAGITVLVSRNKQRLGDMAAGTYVVRTIDLDYIGMEIYDNVIKINKNTKPIAIIAVGLVMGIIFVGLAAAVLAPKFIRPVQQSRINQSFKTISSLDNKFEFSAPDDWIISENILDANSYATFALGNTNHNTYVMVLEDDKKTLSNDINLEKYTEKVQNNMSKSFENTIVTNPIEIEINGRKAMQFTMTGEYKVQKVKQNIFTIETTGTYYLVIGWTSESSYDMYKDKIEKVIRSLKINDDNLQ